MGTATYIYIYISYDLNTVLPQVSKLVFNQPRLGGVWGHGTSLRMIRVTGGCANCKRGDFSQPAVHNDNARIILVVGVDLDGGAATARWNATMSRPGTFGPAFSLKHGPFRNSRQRPGARRGPNERAYPVLLATRLSSGPKDTTRAFLRGPLVAPGSFHYAHVTSHGA